MPLTLDDIDRVTAGKIGTFDVPCPVCGPERPSGANQKRKVLRIWRIDPAFATYRCARCDLHGYAREDGAPRPDAAEIAKARSEAQRFGAASAEGKRQKARWLWTDVGPLKERLRRRICEQRGVMVAHCQRQSVFCRRVRISRRR